MVSGAIQQYQSLASSVGDLSALDPSSPQFIESIVFDQRQVDQPKSKFGYLFPSNQGALISIRLQPDLDQATRREAIDQIREAIASPAFALKDGGYQLSGVPVVVQGLADELGGQIVLLLGVAIVVMAMTLIAAFGPPLRMLPLFVALGASAVAFGLLAIIGGGLTLTSVAVLPVVIGLGVDYAIQLQARFREALASGERPPAAAVIAAVRGGPVIGTAALATAVGFLSLVFSSIPMVREFALALTIGIVAALLISLSAGLAALSMTAADLERTGGARRAERWRRSLPRPPARLTSALSAISRRGGDGAQGALATAIGSPGRVLVIATVLAVTGWVAGTRTAVVSDVRELVPGDLPALQSLDALQSTTGVSGELDVLVKGTDVTTPEAVIWMADLRKRVLEDHGFTGEFPRCQAAGVEICPGPSLPDLIQTGDAPPTAERIQSVLSAVPDYFLQAILSRPPGQDQVASLSFLIPVMPLDEQETLIDSIRSELRDPPAGISAEVVGLPVLAADANAELSGSRYWLTLISLLAVGLVLLAVYRSFTRALVPLIPIALATGWSALLLAATGVPLNPMSATLGVLVIAVATEFSVILSARYHEERHGQSVGEALRRTYSRTGSAVLASGITSIAGFGVLIASHITMLRDFGLVTVVDLGVSLIGVMLVLPAALIWAESGAEPFPALASRIRSSVPRLRGPADATR